MWSSEGLGAKRGRAYVNTQVPGREVPQDGTQSTPESQKISSFHTFMHITLNLFYASKRGVNYTHESYV